jgi:pSer/pThr/pTyr-binding forkhead associated (FHA) protein
MADALRVSVLFKGKELLSRTFAKDRILIGRDPDCDLRLNSSEISRHHATIERRDVCGYLLCDLKSSNGIFVGGEKVSLAPIRERGHAKIGRYDLEFHLLDVPWERHEELGRPEADAGDSATLRAGD